MYNAAKAGDTALLLRCLMGATAEDFNWERKDVRLLTIN
jgi:hypothetical protein